MISSKVSVKDSTRKSWDSRACRQIRLLLIDYFEGIDSERGIAWRAADFSALRMDNAFAVSGMRQIILQALS